MSQSLLLDYKLTILFPIKLLYFMFQCCLSTVVTSIYANDKPLKIPPNRLLHLWICKLHKPTVSDFFFPKKYLIVLNVHVKLHDSISCKTHPLSIHSSTPFLFVHPCSQAFKTWSPMVQYVWNYEGFCLERETMRIGQIKNISLDQSVNVL